VVPRGKRARPSELLKSVSAQKITSRNGGRGKKKLKIMGHRLHQRIKKRLTKGGAAMLLFMLPFCDWHGSPSSLRKKKKMKRESGRKGTT